MSSPTRKSVISCLPVNPGLPVADTRTDAQRRALKTHFPELLWLERLLSEHAEKVAVTVESTLLWRDMALPFYSIRLGNIEDNTVPVMMFSAGVHGIERIGTQVLLAWLHSVLERMSWDGALADKLSRLKLVLTPIVNPVGMYANRRANGQGVDLNRNSPICAEERVPWLGGGHRLSRRLPWFRGASGAEMEPENRLLEQVLRRDVFDHDFALVLDLHSGFGMHDRLWFPYAFRRKPIGCIHAFLALKLLWERCYPNHNYLIEPQSQHYLSHGDIWDYFYLQAKQRASTAFLPLTLEMGSWAWVKKRPLQLLNIAGLFNPQKAHRHSRVLRRHLVLFDFLVSAASNFEQWFPQGEQQELLKQAAYGLWY